ncbi:hypothetical protein DCOP10_11439 [Armatimonadetes bacterium DC]|nr:hypothetical protein DCOP10_11439 [Armatimonadetes bacterium DC]
MPTLQEIEQLLSGAFSPEQVQVLTSALLRMSQEILESEVIKRVDHLESEMRERFALLLQQVEALTAQTQANTQAIQTLTEQTRANTEQLRAHTEQIAVLTEQTRANTQAIQVLTEQTRANTEQLKVHTQQIEALTEQTRANTEQLRVHSEQIAALTEQTRANTEQLRVHSEQIAALTEQTRANTEQLKVHTQQIEALTEQTRANTEQLRVHSEQIAALTEQTRANTEQLRVHAQQIEALTRQTEANTKQIAKNTRAIRDLAKQVGGLAMTVGYTLENEAYKALPQLLKRDYGLEVVGRLKRGFITVGEGQHYELNILGEARRNGELLTIVGESKAQLSRNDIDNFLRRKLRPLSRHMPNLFPVLVAHMVSSPRVMEYAQQQGVAVYLSYDF